MGGVRKMRPRIDSDQDVYTLALERTALILDQFDHVAVAFSGGKDSTAVLNVTLEVARSGPRFARHLPLRCVFYDEEAIPYETEDYVRRVAGQPDIALEWYCLPVKHRNACSRKHPNWWPWAPEAEHLWCRPLPPEAITTLPGFTIDPPEARAAIPELNGKLFAPDQGNCVLLMGIRAQESVTRLRAVRGRPVENYIVKYEPGNSFGQGSSQGNVWKGYPVYDWSTEDVWTYPAMRGLDYNRAYDRMEMAGITHGKQRCSPAFGEEPLLNLHMFAQCFPDVWDKMTARVPGVGAAARYATTELWAHKGRPEKPRDMTWPEFILFYLDRFDPHARAIAAERVRDLIARHYRKTSDPILPFAPHPLSGLSWGFVLRIAMRGDFKKRNDPVMRVPALNKDGTPRRVADAPAVTRVWYRYARELAQIIADGRWAELAAPGPPSRDPYALIPEHARKADDA